MKKRILTFILVLCALAVPATLLSVTAFADGSPTYAFDNATGTLTISGTGTITKADVTTAVVDTDTLKSLVIEDGVTSIGDDAFKSYTNLTSVVVKGDVSVGNLAFASCSALETAVFFGDVDYIGIDAFHRCSLQTFYFFGNVKDFDTRAFADIGTSSLMVYAVKPNEKLYGIFLANDISDMTCGASAGDNVTWKFTTDGTLTVSGSGAMADYNVVTDSHNGTVTVVSDNRPWAGLIGMIKKVVIEDGVTGIGQSAFEQCSNLESVSIDGDVSIAKKAFYWCGNLKSVNIGGNANIGWASIAECSNLTNVSILGGVEDISSGAFELCSALANVYILGDVEAITGTSVFYGCPSTLICHSYAENSVLTTYCAANNITFSAMSKGFTVTDGKLGTDYTYDRINGVLTILSDAEMTIENVDKTTATSHRIVVKKDISANITLAGVNIATGTASPFEIEANSTGDVTITLKDGTTNTLKATSRSDYAALQKEGSGEGIGTLTIKGGTLGTGKLIAEAADYSYAAAIGGGAKSSASNIIIAGGNITAISEYGAGIGSGGHSTGTGSSVSNITITDGVVTATSAGGAGIGSACGYGNGGDVSNITITGGIVTATSISGAGIGSGCGMNGDSGAVSNITISGGTVTAMSENGAGIGSGWARDISGTTSKIVITGGSVKATSTSGVALGCQPTDGEGNNVYLLTVATSFDTVAINEKEYPNVMDRLSLCQTILQGSVQYGLVFKRYVQSDP